MFLFHFMPRYEYRSPLISSPFAGMRHIVLSKSNSSQRAKHSLLERTKVNNDSSTAIRVITRPRYAAIRTRNSGKQLEDNVGYYRAFVVDKAPVISLSGFE